MIYDTAVRGCHVAVTQELTPEQPVLEQTAPADLSTVQRRLRWLRRPTIIECVVALSVAVLSAKFLRMFTYTVDVPFWDQWTFAEFLQKADSGGLQWSEVWAPHNEHRIVVPRLILLFLAERTGWNIRAEIALCFLLILARCALVLLTVYRIGGRGAATWLSFPAIAAVLLSSGQVENLIWGWQLTLTLSAFCLLGACLLVADGRELREPQEQRPSHQQHWSTRTQIGRLVAATLFSLIAQFSFASGVVLWPLGAFALLFWRVSKQRRVTYIVAWLAVGAIATFFYNRGLPATPTTNKPTVLDLFRYTVTFLGAPLSPNRFPIAEEWGWRFGVIGVVAGLVMLALLAYTGQLRRWSPLLIWGLSAPLTAALTAYGRLGKVGIPVSQSMSSRYITLSAPLWATLAAGLTGGVLALRRRSAATQSEESSDGLDPQHIVGNPFARSRVRIAALLIASLAFAGLVTATSRGFDKYARERGVELLGLRAYLADEKLLTDEKKTWMFPDPAVVDRMRPYLIERRFSVFRSRPRA
jgi:hypothetical protein